MRSQARQADPGRPGERAAPRGSSSSRGRHRARLWRRCSVAARRRWPAWSWLLGYGYDLVAKGTAWSWLPFAIGIPLLPAYGWLGAAGDVPASFLALLPMAVGWRARRSPSRTRGRTSSGTWRRARIRSPSGSGSERAWRLHGALLAGDARRGTGLARVSVEWDFSISPRWVAAAGLIGAGGLSGRGDRPPTGRGRAWQFEAVGAARWPCWSGWLRASRVTRGRRCTLAGPAG